MSDTINGEVINRGMLPIVRPVMSLAEAQGEWDTYQELENTLLTDTDYIYFVEWTLDRRGRTKRATATTSERAQRLATQNRGTVTRRKTKSAFRKMARFFGLSLPAQTNLTTEVRQLGDKFIKVEKGSGYTAVVYMDAGFGVIKAEHSVTISHPSGATMIGVGACSINEGRSFTHPDHDIIATSYTRALNRAVSDLIGWGEVSAEEIESDAAAQTPSGFTPDAQVSTASGITMAAFLAEAFALGYNVTQLTERFGNLSSLDWGSCLDILKAEQTPHPEPEESVTESEGNVADMSVEDI